VVTHRYEGLKMSLSKLEIIDERFVRRQLPEALLEMLWARGWRHFGSQYFRHNYFFYSGYFCSVQAIRIRVADFRPSRSQRRVLRKNADLELRISEINITHEVFELFEKHKERFGQNGPRDIFDVIATSEERHSGKTLQFSLYQNGHLLAVSFLDLAGKSSSGLYAFFHPSAAKRSLGIYTMLCEIEFTRENKMKFYYPGYVFREKSFYDYKKRFRPAEVYDWHGRWLPYEPEYRELLTNEQSLGIPGCTLDLLDIEIDES